MRAAVPSVLARRYSRALAALACLLAATGAQADTVLLRNGDRLTGRVVHMSPGTLSFETGWGAKLKVPRHEIASIETSRPVAVLREDGSEVESVVVTPGEADKVELTPAARWRKRAQAADPAPADSAAPDSAAPAADASEVAQSDEPPPEALPLASLRYINPKPEESGVGASYTGRATLSGVFSHGETRSDRFYTEGDFNAHALDWRYALTGKYLYERGADGSTAAEWNLAGNHDRFIDESDKSFVYVRGSIERDRFGEITERYSLGGGYGRQLLQSDRTSISLRGGVETIRLRRDGGPVEVAPALGWGLNVAHRIDLLSAELFHDQRGYQTLGSTSALTLRSRTGLRMPLPAGLSASLQLNLDWDGERTPGNGASDVTWLLGLGYSW